MKEKTRKRLLALNMLQVINLIRLANEQVKVANGVLADATLNIAKSLSPTVTATLDDLIDEVDNDTSVSTQKVVLKKGASAAS